MDSEKTIAWTLALGYLMNWGAPAKEFAESAELQAWFRRLAEIQKTVVAPLSERRLTSFKHDRSAIFREGNDPVNEDDDGFVIADYEGGYRLIVNLGPVERIVDDSVLAAAGLGAFCG